MGRSPDDVAEELLRRYMRITGAVPTFRDFLDARACAMREMGSFSPYEPAGEEPMRCETVSLSVTRPPAPEIRVANSPARAVEASLPEPKKDRQMSPVKLMVREPVVEEQRGRTDVEAESGVPGKEKLSDFEILRSVQDEWN